MRRCTMLPRPVIIFVAGLIGIGVALGAAATWSRPDARLDPQFCRPAPAVAAPARQQTIVVPDLDRLDPGFWRGRPAGCDA